MMSTLDTVIQAVILNVLKTHKCIQRPMDGHHFKSHRRNRVQGTAANTGKVGLLKIPKDRTMPTPAEYAETRPYEIEFAIFLPCFSCPSFPFFVSQSWTVDCSSVDPSLVVLFSSASISQLAFVLLLSHSIGFTTGRSPVDITAQ